MYAAPGTPSARQSAPPTTCRHCGAAPPRFLRNGVRSRRTLHVADGLVHIQTGLLVRWKCPECRQSFTAYPPDVMPFKHFDRPTIRRICRAYLMVHDATYRSCVSEEGMAIAYPDPDPLGRAGDETGTAAFLSHSSLYRWLSSLAQEQTPESTRPTPYLIATQSKCRSRERAQVIRQCFKILDAVSACPDSQSEFHPRLGNKHTEQGR